MTYFTISELCASDTATRLHISNVPSAVVKQHLTELVDTCLDSIRQAWGSSVNVTSGYRGKKLNTAVHGSATSAHMTGYAADTQPGNGDMKGYQKCVLEWAKTHTFDQIIIEYPVNDVAKWIHIGVRNGQGLQRRQILYTLNGAKYLPVTEKFYRV